MIDVARARLINLICKALKYTSKVRERAIKAQWDIIKTQDKELKILRERTNRFDTEALQLRSYARSLERVIDSHRDDEDTFKPLIWA